MGPRHSRPKLAPEDEAEPVPEQMLEQPRQQLEPYLAGTNRINPLALHPADQEESLLRYVTMPPPPSNLMRGELIQASEGDRDALSVLKHTAQNYGVAEGSSSGPRNADDANTMQVALTATAATSSVTAVPADNGGVAQITNMWDPDDEEFDRWPGQETLKKITARMSTNRGTFQRSRRLGFFNDTMEEHAQEQSTTGTEDECCDAASVYSEGTQELILELKDMESGNPLGRDKHDQVMRQFYSNMFRTFPPTLPARYMHLIEVDDYLNSTDPAAKYANPRLCDAVATVLFKTNPQCLEDFLNPEVEIFEWRRSPSCVMIHRRGTDVTVGTYHNFGTQYVWSYFVRSQISSNGTWTETYAALTRGATAVTRYGVLLDEYVAEEEHPEFSPDDRRLALYIGRELGFFLIENEVWDYRRWMRFTIEWEANGRTTRANDIDSNQVTNLENEWYG